MEFDKLKVFTPFNCEEVKVGSKGYVSENAEEKIKEMDFCNLVGFDEDKSSLSSVIE